MPTLSHSLKKVCAVALTLLVCSINAMPAVNSAHAGTIGVRSGILDFVDEPCTKKPGHVDEAAPVLPDGLLVIRNGVVKECGPYEATKLLFGVMAGGDDRAVYNIRVYGKRLYKCGTNQ